MEENADVVISYPNGLSDWRRDQQLDTPRFRAYLRRTLESAEEGTTLEEFIGGGCGSTRDVRLKVVQSNAEDVDENTTIAFVERDD